MRAELKRLHHETGTTIIYVTHDQVEALTMSTRIALYRKGELVQVAPPLELYDNPVNLYTADLLRWSPAVCGSIVLSVSWASSGAI